MTEEQNENEHYPWARALMMIVLYGALLIFLWHFPTEGGRVFFQTLFNGFLYGIAALVLIAITLAVLLLFPVPPFLSVELESVEEPLEEDADDASGFYQTIFPGRVVLVSALKDAVREAEVWSVLYEIKDELEPGGSIIVDVQGGAIGVLDGEANEADLLINEIQKRLRKAKISVCAPG